jgi:hypothetical protein
MDERQQSQQLGKTIDAFSKSNQDRPTLKAAV